MGNGDPQQFYELYDQNIDRFKDAKGELLNQLQRILEEQIERRYFRVRLTEGRVKDADSLLAKVIDDGIQFVDVFEKPGAVRDLIGVRIVCHNLDDIEEIYRKIHGQFIVREMVDGSKDFVSNPVNGYRAHHIDVSFAYSGIQYQAEVQIRTLLQDAWATFMHDDVYKGPLKRFFVTNLSKMFDGSSNAIFGLDQMSQSLRTYIENNPVDSSVKSTVGDALQHQMNTFLDYYLQSNEIEQIYKKVFRIDRYEISGADGKYSFWMHAQAEEPCIFEFILGGDSGLRGITDLTLFKLEGEVNSIAELKGMKASRVPHTIHQSSANTITIGEKSATANSVHAYRVDCSWSGIFTQDVEYIFAPWRMYYRCKDISYSLEVSPSKKLKRNPRLYFGGPSDPIFGDCIHDYMSNSEKLGMDMEYNSQTGEFFKDFEALDKVLYCLMRIR